MSFNEVCRKEIERYQETLRDRDMQIINLSKALRESEYHNLKLIGIIKELEARLDGINRD